MFEIPVFLGDFFTGHEFNQALAKWDVSSVTDMESMFDGDQNPNNPHSGSAFNHPLESWNVAKVANMIKMFKDAPVFNQPLGMWDVSRVTKMQSSE